MPVIDLKRERPLRHAPATLREGPAHVHGQTHLFTDHRSPTHAYLAADTTLILSFRRLHLLPGTPLGGAIMASPRGCVPIPVLEAVSKVIVG